MRRHIQISLANFSYEQLLFMCSMKLCRLCKKFNIIHQFAFCILFRAHNAKVRRLDLYYLHIIQNGKDIERNLIND